MTWPVCLMRTLEFLRVWLEGSFPSKNMAGVETQLRMPLDHGSSARDLCRAMEEGTRPRDSEQMCRICLDVGGHDLIAPCHCSGTSKWVHRSCVDRWRTSRVNPRSFTHCSECGFAYKLVLQRPEGADGDMRLRRRQILGKLFGNALLSFMLLQIWLISLALVIRFCDPSQKLAQQFVVWDKSVTPFDPSYHYKAVYYIAAILISLFLLGVVASVMAICWPFHRQSEVGECCRPSANCCLFGDCGEDCCNACCTGCCRGCSRASCLSECPQAAFCGEEIGGAALFIIVVFIFAGLLFALILIVTAVHRAVQSYIQVQQIRELTAEYVVQDLSMESPSPMVMDAGFSDASPTAPASTPSWAPVTDDHTQQQLTRDMQAVYGSSF